MEFGSRQILLWSSFVACLLLVSFLFHFPSSLEGAPQLNPVWSYTADSNIDSLKVSGDGKYVLLATDLGHAYLLNSNGKLVQKFNFNQRGYNTGLSFDAGGIIVGASLYNRDGELISTFSSNLIGPGGYSVSMSPDGASFSASSDSGVKFLQHGSDDRDIVWSVGFNHGVLPTRASVSPDARSVIVVSVDSQIQMLSSNQGESKWATTLGRTIIGFASSYDGSFLAISTDDGSLKYLDGTGKVLESFLVPNLAISVSSGMIIPQKRRNAVGRELCGCGRQRRDNNTAR